MTSLPKYYVMLKDLYRKKFEQQTGLIAGYVQKRLASLERPVDSISKEVLIRFVKNVRNMKVARMRSIEEEHEKPPEDLWLHFMDMGDTQDDQEPPPKNIQWYYGYRGLDAFFEDNGRLPGTVEGQRKQDISTVTGIVQKLFEKCG